MSDPEGLYTLLGVGKYASQEEIKRAYRKMAVVYHPDKNPEGGAVFRDVSNAYKVLGDPEQRGVYDAGNKVGRRRKDPGYDPDVELEGDALKSFVDGLAKGEVEAAERRRAFDEKRREEALRRREFEKRNPTFKMPIFPDIPQRRTSSFTSKQQPRPSFPTYHYTPKPTAAYRSTRVAPQEPGYTPDICDSILTDALEGYKACAFKEG